MKFNSCLILITTMLFAVAAEAANEPYAGAITHKDSKVSPHSEFRPGNMTDIIPSLNKGPKKDDNQEVYFSADELEADENDGVIVARGNVEVIRGRLTLHSDKLWYNQKHDQVVAEGNVVLQDVDGSVLYTDKIALSDKMNRAEVNKIKVIMRDESRIWADSFLKKRNNNKQMRNASYTACDMCEGKSPLWQIDARKVNYDAVGQNINYNDAVVRIKNVPVFYLPFLSHPAPEVKRRSGLLMTSIGSSSYLGSYVQPTYFWNISEQTDLILSPYFTSDRDVVLGGQYRQYFYNGHINAEGSFLRDDGEYKKANYYRFKRPEHRGHLFMDARYEINDYWVSHLDLKYVSDAYYPKDMSITGRDDAWLTSKLAFERFEGRDYATIEGYYYKLTSLDLKEIDNNRYRNRMKDMPFVAPYMEYEHISDPDKYGSYFKTNLSEASVYRDDDEETHRISMINSWELPYTSDYGEQYKVVASVKSDMYRVDNYNYSPNNTFDGNLAQVFPQLGVEWRLPFVRASDTTRQIVEPVVVATFAPNKEVHTYKIPNADSADAEFDDANILSLDRYAGYDRNDVGSRVSYGLNWSSYGDVMGHTSAFIAQSYQLSDDSTFMKAVEDDDRKFSDYVGRIYATPNDYLDLNYRFRLDKRDFAFKYNELGASVGADILKLYTSYIYLRPSRNSYYTAEDRKELYFRVSSNLTKNWSISFYDRIDLTDGGGQLENGGQVAYEDECLRLAFVAERHFYDDRTLDNDYEFGVTFFFKTLGGFGSK